MGAINYAGLATLERMADLRKIFRVQGHLSGVHGVQRPKTGCSFTQSEVRGVQLPKEGASGVRGAQEFPLSHLRCKFSTKLIGNHCVFMLGIRGKRNINEVLIIVHSLRCEVVLHLLCIIPI